MGTTTRTCTRRSNFLILLYFFDYPRVTYRQPRFVRALERDGAWIQNLWERSSRDENDMLDALLRPKAGSVLDGKRAVCYTANLQHGVDQ